MEKMQASNKPFYTINKRSKNDVSCKLYPDYSKTQVKCEKNNSATDTEDDATDTIINTYQTPIDLSLQEFEKHIPKWCAIINYKGVENIRVVNTCTIDYFLFALWSLQKKLPTFVNNLPAIELLVSLKEIINSINLLKWNDAREFWIVHVMKYNRIPTNGSISLFGSEYDMFIKYLMPYQLHNLIQICSDGCLISKKILFKKERDLLIFKKINGETKLHTFNTEKSCNKCKKDIKPEFRFLNKPNFVIIELPGDIYIDEIPPLLKIESRSFRWFCTSLNKRNHFIAVYDLDGNKYIIDDMASFKYS